MGLARRYGGSGLGTTIAKRLTEAMGGTIGFESAETREAASGWSCPSIRAGRPGAGRLPVRHRTCRRSTASPAERHRVRRPVPAPSRACPQHADPDCRRPRRQPHVLQRLLQKAGHRVTRSKAGNKCSTPLEVADYDAVIVDLHMPDVSGLDLLQQLRLMEAGGQRRTPVMVLSADVTPESIQACERAGARAFLAKPVSTTRLLDALADIASAIASTAALRRRWSAAASPEGDGVFDPTVLDELASWGWARLRARVHLPVPQGRGRLPARLGGGRRSGAMAAPARPGARTQGRGEQPRPGAVGRHQQRAHAHR